jgi:hypothetical protein
VGRGWRKVGRVARERDWEKSKEVNYKKVNDRKRTQANGRIYGGKKRKDFFFLFLLVHF